MLSHFVFADPVESYIVVSLIECLLYCICLCVICVCICGERVCMYGIYMYIYECVYMWYECTYQCMCVVCMYVWSVWFMCVACVCICGLFSVYVHV